MINYEVTVFTGNLALASTFNSVYITLVGTDGESKRIDLTSWKPSFLKGQVSHFIVSCPKFLGKLVMIKLDKQKRILKDSWYPAKVEVKSPKNKTYHFPIYHWITDSEVYCFREGTALRIFDDSNSHVGGHSRQQELKQRQKVFRSSQRRLAAAKTKQSSPKGTANHIGHICHMSWDVYAQGIPQCIKADSIQSLPYDVQFSFTKTAEMKYTAVTGLVELELIEMAELKKKWTHIDDISHLLCAHRTQVTDFVHKHWKEDSLFGYQFLNGVNPMLIRCCKALPKNFPVTGDMVSLHGGGSLADEMMKGNIFLCDYKLLDGVQPNTISRKKQYLMAPLILLQKTSDNKLMPIAIQLKQKPAKDNPIFLPTDSEYDWLLAKIFVRSANFNFYEVSVHLLRTHLLAEVFTVSLLRNLPMVHPLYKLLMPHTRYTLQINVLARQLLISQTGVLTRFAASGGKGVITILQKSLSSLTYSSLCIPDDIAERGLKDVPNFYYRDDGLKLWEIIFRFVKEILTSYYKTDAEVQKDSELQNWIHDIYEHGFLSQASTGIPQKFTTVDEMIKFVTMVIFTCSAQHSAVNSGQYDFGAWMPNSPVTLQLPPPTKKGKASEKSMLDTFPDIQTTVHGMAVMWLLSKQSSDSIFLGQYPEEHFSEEVPCQKIKDFQVELKRLSAEIKARNSGLDLPYTYLDPEVIENSVSI
ncbi:hydroperoxide isomerase ALOXE3 isoform X1 [Oreochromis niloticus]|uniref:Hydroperoxide isomerase ALOXE3 n=3 Tax=Oreochromis TaxID=8139 RepID=A0A669AXA2_ORENI|nr:hydroperoxide isomerase ALOXE3 isoform X1 [Oreochromis niloticus]XP_025759235.1 hydroperoxide isomerase ALOXE3 isoform X1 [Oreochromis niloticus]